MERIPVIVFFLSIGLCFQTSLLTHAGVISPELESILSTTGTEQEVPVLITLADKVDLSHFKEKDHRFLRSQLIKALREKARLSQLSLKVFLEKRGVKEVRELWAINGMLVKAKPGVIREVSRQPGILSIRPDQIQRFRDRFRGTSRQSPRRMKSRVRKSPAFRDAPPDDHIMPSAAKPEWNLDLIRAPELWKLGVTGKGTVVANMDTGVDIYHPDLRGKWRGGKNSWFDPNGEHDMPQDVNGHGTQTMSIMVGGYVEGTAIGVAPGAKWIAVKIYNNAGQTSIGICHLGFQWLLDPDGDPETDDSPDVVNFSWGFNQYTNQCNPEFQEDIRILRVAQIAVVVAGGNEGPQSSTSLSPANYAESLSVGAIDQSMKIANFSSRGPSACADRIYPALVAPGVMIKTADLTFNGIFPNSKTTVTGTSFASAHVSGGLALLKSAFPQSRLSEIEYTLKESARDLGKIGEDHTYGSGLIDLMKTYQMILSKEGEK